MEDNYKFATLMHWIAAVAKLPRNDGGGVNNRHCEESKTTRQSSAFSLIELLISLIIISLIVSSFIPIITRKMKHHNATISSGVMNCKKFDEKCMLCDKKECTLCATQINLLDGQYVNPKVSCEVKQCPDNCAKCDKGECLKCDDGYGLVNKTCVKCPDNCDKCNGEICTQCKEDYSLNDRKCIKGACVKVGNICVQRFNAGDKGGLEIPANLVEIINPTDTNQVGYQISESARATCWIGQTGKDASCNSNGTYSGCERSVCTWYAATKICAHYGLRLPTYSEAALFNSKLKDLGLCSNENNAFPICKAIARCPGGHENLCRPYGMWCQRLDKKTAPPNSNSEPVRNGGVAYDFNNEWKINDPNAGSHGGAIEDTCNSIAYSVRCVKDL